MEVIDGSTRGILIGQKRYEGYCIDLINHIANFLRFKGIVFQLVTDGYGNNPQTRTWNGLIRSILNYVSKIFCILQRKKNYLLKYLKILLETNLKIILLDCQNNFIEGLS